MNADSLKSGTLYAIHKHIAVKCKECNEAWLKCKEEHADPKHCTEVGKSILRCVNELYVALLDS
jgi:antirestriction protein